MSYYDSTLAAIYSQVESEQEDSRRPHLGGSIIGKECSRNIWYTFRWAKRVFHDGRLLLLFDRGHKEEERFVERLRSIGVEVHDVDSRGEQFTVASLGGHFGGSLDGVALNLMEAPKTWHVLEFKTHSEWSFKSLKNKGVLEAKPEHYTQMQVYMDHTGIKRAFYMAVNKNTDELYTQRIEYDKEHAKAAAEKAEWIINANDAPDRVGPPSHKACRYCDFSSICHEGATPDRNCRTCLHSTAVIDGTIDAKWTCALGHSMTDSEMREVRPCHRFLPTMIGQTTEDIVSIKEEAIIYADGHVDAGPDQPGTQNVQSGESAA